MYDTSLPPRTNNYSQAHQVGPEMKRLLVNDTLNSLGERTLWNKLQDWFDLEFVCGDYMTLAAVADKKAVDASLIIRSASWFPPIPASQNVPTIGLLQEILAGKLRAVQDDIINSCTKVVANSQFTRSHYSEHSNVVVIPLSIDFGLFQPGNRTNLQKELNIPDRAVCWVGASQGPEGRVKNFEKFMNIVHRTPDISYVAVFKDEDIKDKPTNLQTFVKLPQDELVKVINACHIGLCTSRIESQHLAGIEMGACGLPMVVPPVGVYWQRTDLPGALIKDGDDWVSAIRATLAKTYDTKEVRDYWYKEFNDDVCKDKWSRLIKEVESGTSGS
ncbi:hypothetical protein A2884_02285 [Candidatus Saccharibacteria bacterium RIFCSPHIGHO2_01_FULL_48_12]|nr:MAG: hypothetical protein A2884_02285 [Candidatus Saccharibacteria bacterium RIFCSPHIGHO2_01_FULL_48_12]